MNKMALDKVLKRLHIQQVYVSHLSLKVDEAYFPGAFAEPTSSLFAWRPSALSFQEVTDADGKKLKFSKMKLATVAKIVKNKTGQPLPSNYEPKAEEVVAEISIVFVADYLVSGEGEIDQEGLRVFAQHNLAYHVWPYWREHLQSIAVRAVLPVPALPFYQVKQEEPKEQAE
jgi:hypothetical protein